MIKRILCSKIFWAISIPLLILIIMLCIVLAPQKADNYCSDLANRDPATMSEVLNKCGTSIDLNSKNDNGDTALIKAVESGETELVAELITQGADPDTTNNDGNTALIVAAKSGNTELVKKLVEAGADFSILNNSGHSAFQYSQNQQIYDYLYCTTQDLVDLIETD
jgi:ankyrin repeat protein